MFLNNTTTAKITQLNQKNTKAASDDSYFQLWNELNIFGWGLYLLINLIFILISLLRNLDLKLIKTKAKFVFLSFLAHFLLCSMSIISISNLLLVFWIKLYQGNVEDKFLFSSRIVLFVILNDIIKTYHF